MVDSELQAALKFSLSLFLKGKQTDIEAVKLLSDHVKMSVPIPEELLPYVGQTIDAWRNVKGAANRRKNKPEKWNNLIWHVHLYRLMGNSKEEAINLVIKYFPVVYDNQKTEYRTLEEYYAKASSQQIKDDAELIYGSRYGREEPES